MLTRDEMAAIIKGHGSVLYAGRIISREQDLPSEADLAAGNPDRAAAVAADLQAQIDRLSADLERLRSAPAAPEAETAAPADTAADGGPSARRK